MPALSDYKAGTITLTNGSTAFTGAGTGWLAADFREGDTIFQVAGQTQWDAVIESITDNTSGVLAEPWGGATGTYTYRMRYMADGARVTAQARNLIELLGNGNALALAGLTGPGVVVFNGAHSMIVKPESDFVNGVFFNAAVNTLADRAVYNGQPGPIDNTPGFTVLVRSDVDNDNRTTLYSKLSDTTGDWSDAAIITGDIGEMPTLEVGTTTTLNPGDDATVDVNSVPGGYEIDFGIPEGRGAKYVTGGYNPATVYTLDQVALDNGSSWILTVPTSTGNAPPILPTTSNAYWSLLARKGTDGTGTGDVVGPASSVNNRVAVFSGATGKLIADGGQTIAQIIASVPAPDLSPLMLTSSILALQVSDNTNLPIYGPNWVADAFDTLGLVDVAGATNLDSSTAGLLKPSGTAAALISGGTGTNIGDMTALGGLAAAFDGTASQASGACAAKLGSGSPGTPISSYVGKNYGGSPKKIGQTIMYPSTDVGFIDGGGATVLTINLYASNTAPTTPTDGTLLGTSGSFTDSITTRVIDSTDKITLWQYVWVNIYSAIGTNIVVAECQFYTPFIPANLTVRSTAMVAMAAPATIEAILPIKEVDAAVPGTDYTVEFSRNDGTNWTVATVTELFNSPSPIAGIIFVRAVATVSGQPTGTNVRWRIKTLTGRMIEFHGIKTDWN